MPQSETLLFILFNLFILGMLVLDLGVFHRKAHAVSVREAAIWSAVWVTLALIFNAGIFVLVDTKTGLEFLTGYVIEKALSMDNIFVFVIIFSYFGVPAMYQHKILFWGVIGALVMRATFILTGVALIARFEWILYLFGLILIVSGWKMATQKETEVHPERNIFIRLARQLFPVTTGYTSSCFFERIGGKLHITPMFLVLITVETTDLVFAVDSIPAIFAITRDPFIVYSSNVFAILGLRSMYFLLAGVIDTFRYLKTGLSIVLIFVGFKMLIAEFVHLPILLSLAIVVVVLGSSVWMSIVRNRRLADQEKERE